MAGRTAGTSLPRSHEHERVSSLESFCSREAYGSFIFSHIKGKTVDLVVLFWLSCL